MKLSRLKHYIKLYMPYKWVLEYEEKRDFFAQYFAWKESNPQVEFDKECKFDSVIGIVGFGYSGSGAVIDLLREYDDCLVHGMAEGGSKAQPAADDLGEISLIAFPGGLMDIDTVIDTPIHYMGDGVLKRFARMIIRDSFYRQKKENRRYIFKFFDSLIENIIRDINGSTAAMMPRMKDNTFKLRDYSKHEYYELCQRLLYSLFNQQGGDNKKYLVLDQVVFPVKHMFDYIPNFIPNIKLLVVWRDPRDIYVLAKHKNIQWIEHDTAEQFIKAIKRKYAVLKQPSSSFYPIRFEDLILDYDKTVANIEKYLNLGEHKRPMSCLDISISCKNIGMWKNAEDIPQEDFEKIYEEVREYCYSK